VHYEKGRFDEVWHQRPSGWERVNLRAVTGGATGFSTVGDFPITLKPGQVYRVGIYKLSHGPNSTDPSCIARLVVVAILKEPEQRTLIVTVDRNVGGTWCKYVATTSSPTTPVLVGVTRERIYWFDNLPGIESTAGAVLSSLPTGTSHTFQVQPLVPGNTYNFAVVLVDGAGNWDVHTDGFTTLRRKLTVKFERIIISNDGDPARHGNAEFDFQIFAGATTVDSMHELERFHLPEMDIDDWHETGRPYNVGFAYVENEPMSIPVERPHIYLRSTGHDLDGIEGKETALSIPEYFRLPLPEGPGETETDGRMTLYCDPAGADDFDYDVDVHYSVQYLP
jgi:hypothetical protein